MTDIKEAVSIVIIYKDKVFTIVRQNHLRAFPGYTAFPGGKVDKEDQSQDEEETLKNAFYREATEELGIDILKLKAQEKIKSISKIAIATSPEYNPRRFTVHFFRVELAEMIEFELDQSEVFKGEWLHPGSILQEYNFGKRLMIFPIRYLLEKLLDDILFNDVIDFDIMPKREIPSIEPLRGLLQIMPESNTLFPATRTNAFIIGDDKKILIDPSPKDIDEYRKLIKVLNSHQLTNILITHHHGDHHQFAPDIARHFGISILLSKDCYSRCLNKYGKHYFEGIQHTFLIDEDEITTWLGQSVKVISVPGHDEGHLAIMPDQKNWCIVGDLFQGLGTVVIGGDEGDMTKYMDSLDKIIKLAPKCVIPSHGIALGGVNILQKTKEHRLLRERQIKKLLEEGKSLQEVLEIVYRDVSKKLHPYAMENIKSHVKKISQK